MSQNEIKESIVAEEENQERNKDLLFNQQYELPEDRDGFVDDSTGEVTEKKDLTGFDVIKAVAKQLGQTIQDPKSNCKKCYGRGFTARDAKTKSPIPCNCIYPPKTLEEKAKDQRIANKFVDLSRKQKRKLMRGFLKESKIKKRKEIEKGHKLSAVPDTPKYEPYKSAEQKRKEAKLARKKERDKLKKEKKLAKEKEKSILENKEK